MLTPKYHLWDFDGQRLVYPFKLAFTSSFGQYRAIIQRFFSHIASFSCELEDGGLHELSLDLVTVFFLVILGWAISFRKSMRGLQYFGTLLTHDDIIAPHISYLTTYSYSLSISASDEYKLEVIWTSLFFQWWGGTSDEVAGWGGDLCGAQKYPNTC